MNNDVSNWSNIGVFLAVCRGGSTLAASKELGLSPATIARRIDALEHALGMELFERDTRGAHPTSAARQLEEIAARFDAASEAFTKLAEKIRDDTKNLIRISAPSPNFSKDFADLLATFSAKHPDAQFKLSPSDQPVDLSSGDVDIAIRYTRHIDDETLICRKVGVEKTTFYASQQYLALNGLPRSPDDLRGQSVVGIMGADLPAFLADWISEHVRPDMISTRCDNVASLIAATQMGKGIGPLPVTLGDSLEGCERVFDPLDAFDIPIWLVTNPNSYRRTAVKRFCRFLGPKLAALIQQRQPESAPRLHS